MATAEQSDLSRLPFPIAYPLHFAHAIDLPIAARWDNAIFAAYQTMRLATLLMLADYLASDDIEPALMSRIRGLRAPHWQEWSLLADALTRFWTDPKRAGMAKFQSVTEGWRSVSRVTEPGKKAPLEPVWTDLITGLAGLGGRGQARSANEAVWEIRNRGAHRAGASTPESVAAKEKELALLLPLVEEMVARVFAGTNFVLLRSITTEKSSPRVIELTGPHPDLCFALQDIDPDWHDALETTEIAAKFGDEEILPVYPFLLPGESPEDKTTTGLTEPVVMIDGIAEGRLTVLGVEGGYTVKGLHLEATLAALKRKHGDLSLERKDVAPWTVVAWARMTTQQTLLDITDRKYFPSFYLERPDVDNVPIHLATIQGKALLLIGDAGSGKSSLIARLADRLTSAAPEAESEDRPEDQDSVVAYLSGRADFAGTASASAEQLLVNAVSRKLGIREGGERRAFASLADLALHLQAESKRDMLGNRRIWLLLDGLNEADRFLDLVRALDAFLPILARLPNFRVVISLRAGAYFALGVRDESLGAHSTQVFSHADYFMSFEDASGKPQPYLEVRPFREADEGPRAYTLRQTALPKRATSLAYTQLAPELRRLLLRPLHLHLFHETWTTRSDTPGTLDEGELFAAYIDGLTNQNAGAALWLDRLAHVMLQQNSAFLPVDEADSWVSEWRKQNGFATAQTVTKLDPVEELVSASLLLRPAETGSGLERALLGYQFTHQKLAERILLRHMDRFLPAGQPLPGLELFQNWAQRAAAAPHFAELTGAVEAWVRRLVLADDPAVKLVLAAILDLSAPAVSEKLIRALVLATDGARDNIAEILLGHLASLAAARREGRNLLHRPAWEAGARLDSTANLAVRQRVWRALLGFSENYATNFSDAPYNQRDLSISYDRLGDLAVAAGERAAAQDWFGKMLAIAERLAALNPADVQAQRDLWVSYDRVGNLAVAAGERAAAQDWFGKMLAIAERLAALNPADVQAQRDLWVSYDRVGNLAVAAGERAAAQDWFGKMLAIAERLAALNPADVQAQRDLSVSYDKLGDLAVAAGERAAAQDWFGKGLAIRERLAALNPADVQAQRDLWVSYDKLGNLAVAAGERAAAQDWFGKMLAIAERLAALNPADVQAQRDLSVSYDRVGDLAVAAGERATAQDWFGKMLAIRERLAALNPADVQAQRDLSVSYDKLGDLAVAAGERAAAQDWFGKMLAIAERLAALNPADVQAQRDLSVSYNRVGDLAVAAGERAAAQDWFGKGLAIRERLAALNPADVQAQRDLSVSYNRVGNLAVAAGERATAQDWFGKMLAIAERLAALNPADVQAQRGLSVSYNKLGNLAVAAGERAAAQDWFGKMLAIAERLAALNPADVQAQRDLSVSYDRVGDLAVAAGERATAQDWFGKGLAIAERLVASDPENLQYAAEVAISCAKLAFAFAEPQGEEVRFDDQGVALLRRAREALAPFIAAGQASAQAQQIYDYVNSILERA